MGTRRTWKNDFWGGVFPHSCVGAASRSAALLLLPLLSQLSLVFLSSQEHTQGKEDSTHTHTLHRGESQLCYVAPGENTHYIVFPSPLGLTQTTSFTSLI